MEDHEVVIISDSNDESTPTGVGDNTSGIAERADVLPKKHRKLPRVYIAAAEALSAKLDMKTQLKSYIFRQNKCRDLGKLRRLVSQAYSNYKDLIDTLTHCGFSFKTCDERLAAVIAADVAFSSERFQPANKHRKVLAIVKLKAALQKLNEIKVEPTDPAPESIVRYAVVNKLKISRERLEKNLKRDGYVKSQFQPPESSTSTEAVLNSYWDHLRSLEIYEYTWDLHFPDDVLAFNVKSGIQTKIPFRRRYLLMYNKSIVAPVRALAATTRDKVLDTCSAPGNKSTLLAQTCNSLVCCERSEKRFKVLCENLETSGTLERVAVKAIHTDFLGLETNDPHFKDCRLALVDPSCSGGGDSEREITTVRIEKLANMQAMCLKKALSLTSMEVVVYSTCSSQSRENEGVVKEILDWAESAPRASHEGQWVLEKALPDLPFRGNEALFPGIGDKCLFFDEKHSKTSVQFVAKFVRKLKKKLQKAKAKRDPEVRKKLKRLRRKQRQRTKGKLMKAQAKKQIKEH
ncbi:hypothetical protein BIW11_12328 [Tropilaelaps mercedesae]|uniref:SAM-dependent MTase RsmB/NOP-type domain-containing protein n=1 Tax=Tropilaelaps mercedesae TaxID=418985 RepID=A0A1V9X717_9ACAR|nr:hypothetical protein BIW11_12328 [Tropilaelaps mercedesae]